uniref:Leucine rich immune protein (Short) n=1 Tax=Anopheles coluzzii TaxID=1518534 RepID=A0A6E8VSX2_ANOCL|nr:uncharacterized protein LOC120951908 [Anopheles coluzzii]
MLLRYHITVALGLLACYAGVVFAASQSEVEIVYKCATAGPKTCFLNVVKLEDANHKLKLVDIEDKTILNIKGGSVVALQPQHCRSVFAKLEKVSIGRVGLKELCFAPSFVYVSAEHNRIRTLHVPEAAPAAYRVEVLRLNDNQLESVESMRAFVALKELHLERNALSTLDMACFAEMPKLEKLYLAYNRLNVIASTVSELSLPALSVLALQNNTLTVFDLRTWSLPNLELLELSANNLTKVSGLDNVQALSDISLAGNRWQCHELDQMLEQLEKNDVTVKDGDVNCDGIRNSSICCKHVEQPMEETLQTNLAKFDTLRERYGEMEARFNETVQKTIHDFEAKIRGLKESYEKRNEEVVPITPKPETMDGENDEEEQSTTDEMPAAERVEKAAQCDECVCSKESIDKVESKLAELEQKLVDNNALLKGLKDNQVQFSYMTVVAKHEFRTAVKRGEYKLKELSSMLAMLREHVKQKSTT